MAFVGMGWAGTRQVEAVAELGRKVEAACLVDTNEQHLKARSEELGIIWICTEYAEVLTNPDRCGFHLHAARVALPHGCRGRRGGEARSGGEADGNDGRRSDPNAGGGGQRG